MGEVVDRVVGRVYVPSRYIGFWTTELMLLVEMHVHTAPGITSKGETSRRR